MEYLHSDLTKGVLNCAFSVHKELGPGLLESSYEACLYYELKQKGYKVDRQVHLPLVYKDIRLDAGCRIGLLINFNVKLLKDGISRLIV